MNNNNNNNNNNNDNVNNFNIANNNNNNDNQNTINIKRRRRRREATLKQQEGTRRDVLAAGLSLLAASRCLDHQDGAVASVSWPHPESGMSRTLLQFASGLMRGEGTAACTF